MIRWQNIDLAIDLTHDRGQSLSESQGVLIVLNRCFELVELLTVKNVLYLVHVWPFSRKFRISFRTTSLL